MVWNIDPIALHIGAIQMHWYGILFASGLLSAYFIGEWIFKKEGVDAKLLDPLFFYIVVGIVVGARLFHVIFYDPIYFSQHPLEILQVWKGGLASHGGAIGAILAIWLFTKKHNLSFSWLLARAMPSTFALATFIRIGNFFNSEIVGLKTNMPWGVIFERVDNFRRHPVVLYESFAYFIIFIILLAMYKKLTKEQFTNIATGFALFASFSVRFFLEYVKTAQAEFANILPLSMGQLLSLPFIALGLFLLIRGIKNARLSS